MFKPNSPRDLAVDLLPRSICSVQVAAVIADNHSIFGWGWNSAGSGFGEHAEAAAIRRSSRKRMKGASIYVAAIRMRNGKPVLAKPCEDCAIRIIGAGVKHVWYRNADGLWMMYEAV